MANFNYDMFRIVDTLVNVQAKLLNKQFAFETTNDRIVVKDAVGAFHYFSKDDDINPTDITITDNIVDAFRVREDTNDYINVDTSDAQAIIYLGNAGTNPDVRILGSGNFSINESAPDSKVCVNIGATSDLPITLKSDVSHGITSFAEADTFCQISEYDSNGGMKMLIYNASLDTGVFKIESYADTGSATVAPIQLMSAKRSGTSAAALADADELFSIVNYTTKVITVKGNGDLATTGKVTGDIVVPTSIPSNPVAGSIYYDNSAPRFLVYDGTFWDYVVFTDGV